MSAKRTLKSFRAPQERETEERAWSAVRSAYRQRPTRPRPRILPRAGIVAASIALICVAVLIPSLHSGEPAGRLRGITTSDARLLARALARPQALVTDEAQNRLLVVDLPSGRVARSVAVPADPEDLATSGSGVVIVVSSRAGEVTILDRNTFKVIKTFGGFDEPHIAAISPDGSYAYITDDARGTLTVIRLSDMKVTATVAVGVGAHHLAFSPTDRTVWVALGENAQQITTLSTVVSRPAGSSPVVDPGQPRVIGHFSPGFAAHDLAFNPNGKSIWITSSTGPDVTAFSASSHHALFQVPVGAGPQHIAFEGADAYLTSGYGSTIEEASAATGKVIARARSPYGSFELSAGDGYVVASSLLSGTLAIYTPELKLIRVVKLAPEAREVAISRP